MKFRVVLPMLVAACAFPVLAQTGSRSSDTGGGTTSAGQPNNAASANERGVDKRKKRRSGEAVGVRPSENGDFGASQNAGNANSPSTGGTKGGDSSGAVGGARNTSGGNTGSRAQNYPGN